MSTPRFIQVPSNVSCIARTIEDLPDRGAPLRTTICPSGCGFVTR
jgi:hypothetical protein